MEEIKPKVSVIVPVYNVELYLRECLDSIVNQTLKDIEIICIDDGGKDNCPQIIDEYAQKDNRIIAIHKKNGGYGHSCNTGLDRATGEYIAIVEPDDFIKLNMYEVLYNKAKQLDSDIVKSGYYENIETEKVRKNIKICCDDVPEGNFNIHEYPNFLYFHPSIWSCIYKKEFLNSNKIRFVEAPGAGWTDNPFQVQTMCLAKKISYVEESFYYWRRLTLNESEDLRDWRLPFVRSDEIHKWLDANNFNDPVVLKELYKRELAYIHIVLKKDSFQERDLCITEIQNMCRRMRPDIVKTMNSYDRFIIQMGTNYVWLLYLKLHSKALRRHVIQFRWRKNEKFLKLFNKTVFDIAK